MQPQHAREVPRMDKADDELLHSYRLAWREQVGKVHPQQVLLTPERINAFLAQRGLDLRESEVQACERAGLTWPVILTPVATNWYRVLERREDGTVTYDRVALAAKPPPGEDAVELISSSWFGARHLRDIAQMDAPILPGTPDACSWRDDTDRETWLPLRWRYYHPYQVFRLQAIERCLRWNAIALPGVSDDAWVESFCHWLAERPQVHEWARERLADSFRHLALLLAVEDLYLPQVQGSGPLLLSGGPPRGEPQDYYEWRTSVDRRGILARLGLNEGDVHAVREDLARMGHDLDPNQHVFPLLRMLSRRDRDRLRGAARLAWDYYEAAELLGLFLGDLTGQKQPQVDDLLDGGHFKQRDWGLTAAEIDYASHRTRAAAARYFGVDAQARVLWFVEGQTEEAFVTAYCELESISLEDEGIELLVLGGVNRSATGGIDRDPLLKAFLRRARRRAGGLLVTVDAGDAGVDDLVRALTTDREDEPALITDVITVANADAPACERLTGSPLGRAVVKWSPTFEDANFDAHLLLDAWLAVSRECRAGTDESDDALRAHLGSCSGQQPQAEPWAEVKSFVATLDARYRRLDESKVDVGRALPEALKTARASGRYPGPLPVETVIWRAVANARMLVRRRESADGILYAIG